MRLSMGVMIAIQRLSRLAALLVGVTLVGCAASPKAELQPGSPGPVQAAPVPASVPATASTSAPEPEPRTLAEAEAMLEKARADLDRLALNEPGRSASGAAAPAPAPPAEGAAQNEQRRAEADVRAEPQADSPCQSACRAFSSLSRASIAVCRLDAGGGKRCERARQIRDDASRRVAGCGCVQ